MSTSSTHLPGDGDATDIAIDCTVFTHSGDGTVSSQEITPSDTDELGRMYRGLSSDQFCWISLPAPSVSLMRGLADVFGIHELIVEDAVIGEQRPKLEHYDDQLLLVARTLEQPDNTQETGSGPRMQTGEVLVVVGDSFVLSIDHRPTALSPDPTPDRTARVESVLRRSFGPHAVLFAVTDAVVDHYTSITDALEEEINELEDAVFSRSGDFSIEDVYLQMREVLTIRHTLDPLTTVLTTLSNHDAQHLAYIRDVLDHQIQASGRIDSYAQRLSTLIDAASARISMQQNTDMRKISAWAGVIAVPTLFTGFYGMNFVHMPELATSWGYPAAIAAILASAIALVVIFRRNNWL